MLEAKSRAATGYRAIIVMLASVAACATEDPAPDPARAALDGATAALRSVQNGAYAYEYEGSGSLTGIYSGTVAFDRSQDGFFFKVEIQPSPTPPPPGSEADEDSDPPILSIATNGREVTARDGAVARFSHGTFAGGSGYLAASAGYGMLFQFAESEPFSAELAGELTYDGTEVIAGVECDVVSASIDQFGGARITWYIGREDRLPRGRDWVSTDPESPGRFSFRIADLEVNTTLLPDALSQVSETHDEIVNEDARLVGPGHPAPRWSAAVGEGTVLRSQDLDGRVAVIEVWASWCTACRESMAAIGSALEEFGDDVRLVGLNVWESSDVAPAAWASERGLRHEVVPRAEGVATLFKVASPPAVFVIGPDGTMVYSANPVAISPADLAVEVEAAVRAAIE